MYLNYIILIILFALMFSFFPQFIHIQVKKLLVYHNYKNQQIKVRLPKIIKVYIILGLIIGIMNIFLLAPLVSQDYGKINSLDVETEKNIHLISLSFIVSFSLVLILRLSILLNKSNILKKFLSNKKEEEYIKNINKIDFRGMKIEVESFLFSIFLGFLLSLMMYFFYNVLFNRNKLIEFGIQITFDSLMNYMFFIILFGVVFLFLAGLIEIILHHVGVNKNLCEDCEEE